MILIDPQLLFAYYSHMAILAFIAVLLISISLGISIIWPLIAGYAIFFIHAYMHGLSAKRILRISLEGIYGARNILLAFVLIGMLTASWRAAGTIPAVITYSMPIIRPEWFLGAAFLVNSLISFLTGTSFGSAATVGVICMTISDAIGMNPMLAGGAILSGVFFGDRCSPVSTSALLVADLTKTDVNSNIPGMVRTSVIPFILSFAAYCVMSFLSVTGNTIDTGLTTLFMESFRIGFIPLLPALIMLILSLLHFSTRRTMAASILSAVIIAIFYEKLSPAKLIPMLITGYEADSAELGMMLNGGGIVSMVNVAIIVAISSSYSGIFHETGMLDGMKGKLCGARIPARIIITAVSTLTAMISCNQTLATMLTHQLCTDLEKDKRKMAIALENTVIVIAPLIPWSIAGSVPLSVVGAPMSSIAAACYLYLLPVCWMLGRKKPEG